jgi:hypothetical protein
LQAVRAEFTCALQGAGGLCLVHLDQDRTATGDVHALERLWAVQRACMQAPDEELREFIRKHDYRLREKA